MYWLFISHLCLNDGFNCIYEYVVLIVSCCLGTRREAGWTSRDKNPPWWWFYLMDQEAMNGQRTQGMEFQATKALHMAARAGHADLCRLLLNHRHSESTDTDGTICMFAFWARPKRWTYLNVIIEMCWYFAATPEAESEIKFELSTGKKMFDWNRFLLLQHPLQYFLNQQLECSWRWSAMDLLIWVWTVRASIFQCFQWSNC